MVLPADALGQPRPHAEHLSYFARLAPAAEFTRLAVVACHRCGRRAAAAAAGVQDGAVWLQGFLDYHCSDAVRILDLPHAVEHLAAAGRAVWNTESAPLQAWLRTQTATLKQHGPEQVLGELRRLQRVYPAAHAGIAEQLMYFEPRRAQMDYPTFVGAGWPGGSGIVESANKLVVEARLKGAGMRWARQQVNPLLGLRTVVCSDRWEEVWPQVVTGWRGQAAAAAAGRRQARRGSKAVGAGVAVAATGDRVAAEGPILVGPGVPVPAVRAAPASAGPRRPAAHHPWRRSPLGNATRLAHDA
ncbi:MAG: hypothetical protein M3Z04_11450 [Chloroflexota bacterium]|nr:hypothetical protein [Chloroflexota bacterium]